MKNNLKQILSDKGISYDKAAKGMDITVRSVQYDVKAKSLKSSKMEDWATYLGMKVTEIFAFE